MELVHMVLSMPMPAPLFVIISVIIVVGMSISAITKISIARSREKTRREIAAYVAEGSITPEQGVAMMSAGRQHENV